MSLKCSNLLKFALWFSVWEYKNLFTYKHKNDWFHHRRKSTTFRIHKLSLPSSGHSCDVGTGGKPRDVALTWPSSILIFGWLRINLVACSHLAYVSSQACAMEGHRQTEKITAVAGPTAQ